MNIVTRTQRRARLAVTVAILVLPTGVLAQYATQDEEEGGSCTRAFADTIVRLNEERDACVQDAFDACQDITPQCVALLVEIGLIDTISGTNPADALSYYCMLKYGLAVEKAWAALFFCLLFG